MNQSTHSRVAYSTASKLRQFPDLVKLTAAKTWNGILPATMVPNGAVPFVEVPAGR
ncbi:hypothetical protein [Chelativorans composti]|uniref:Uncharacterized protein n=1 Tax=Chelativorans composti TaxID=768533 RepID=A0ABW5DI11_9HYPH